jgi:hypothetical protein
MNDLKSKMLRSDVHEVRSREQKTQWMGKTLATMRQRWKGIIEIVFRETDGDNVCLDFSGICWQAEFC